MTSVHTCRQSMNPRNAGYCACGQRIPQPVRNRQYEHEFLATAAQQAESRYGTPADGFVQRVLDRLEIGRERYGDDDFTQKDVLRELLEETPDAAAYAVLEAQKTSLDESDEKAWHLFECSVHAAAADFHARAARRND